MSAIKVKPWGKGQGDFVWIEEENFDPDFHEHLDQENGNGGDLIDDETLKEFLMRVDELDAKQLTQVCNKLELPGKNKGERKSAIKEFLSKE